MSEILYTGKELRKHLGRNVMRRKKPSADTITKVLDFFEHADHRLEFGYADKYGEPGYSDPEALVLFGNWNYTDREFGDVLEGLGFEAEWCDEWVSVNDKAYRIQPDSYGWVSQIHCTEGGEYLTPDSDLSEWLEEMQDNPRMALPEWVTREMLEEAGWQRVEERYENGFHPGQDDDPKKIYDKLIKQPDVHHVVFRISDKGQFDIKFEAYTKGESE